jgi:hypothetical protein
MTESYQFTMKFPKDSKLKVSIAPTVWRLGAVAD